MIKYSDNPLLKLKSSTPFFYKMYNISVFVTYIGFIIISWYFINLAYTINTPSYDILCLNCNLFFHVSNIVLLSLWLFFLYFYILNEIRFRCVQYSGKVTEEHIQKVNILCILLAVMFMGFTMLYTL